MPTLPPLYFARMLFWRHFAQLHDLSRWDAIELKVYGVEVGTVVQEGEIGGLGWEEGRGEVTALEGKHR